MMSLLRKITDRHYQKAGQVPGAACAVLKQLPPPAEIAPVRA